MSRYIDADLLVLPYGYCEDASECYEALNTLPSIDIVRCLDCVHWKADKYFCVQFHVGTPADGYCYMAKEQTETTTGTDCSWK